MRPNPPFDPRLQQGGVYVGNAPQVYRQPIIHPNQLPQTGFVQPTQYPQAYIHGSYPLSSQHQVISQPAPNQTIMQSTQIPVPNNQI